MKAEQKAPLTPALSREGRGSPGMPAERASPSPLAGEGTGVRGAFYIQDTPSTGLVSLKAG